MTTRVRPTIPITILVCDDDAADRSRTQQMFEETVERIKDDPALLDIPMVMLTTSGLDSNVIESHRLRRSLFIAKPLTVSGLVGAMNVLGRFWFELLESPTMAP
jgi:hypothetical protein